MSATITIDRSLLNRLEYIELNKDLIVKQALYKYITTTEIKKYNRYPTSNMAVYNKSSISNNIISNDNNQI